MKQLFKSPKIKPSKQNGSQTVEFAMVLLMLFLLFLIIFEIALFLWTSMMFNSRVDSAVRQARTMAPSYSADIRMKENISSETGLIDAKNLTLSPPFYAKSIGDLVSRRSVTKAEAQLGLYEITYNYELTFLPFFSKDQLKKIGKVFEFKRVAVVSYEL